MSAERTLQPSSLHIKPVPPRVKDFAGKIFGHRTVLGFAGLNKIQQSTWYTRCSCLLQTVQIVAADRRQLLSMIEQKEKLMRACDEDFGRKREDEL